MFQTKNLIHKWRGLSLPVLTVLLLNSIAAYGQTTAILKGKVYDNTGTLLPAASVTIESSTIGAICDEDGAYRLSTTPGTYRVSAVMVGFTKQTKEVTLTAGKTATLDFSLEENTHALQTVEVTGEKSQVQKIREQSFTVSSIDVTPMQNLNLDVNTILNRTTGVRIRQGGGLGSDFSFSLNGFSGSQVRFFIDGINADFLGSSMKFNNIPVNIIERIEVYKGVVPVNLGADALGGAVNIVTSDNAKDFLDVSYNYGSFNTHQAAVASRKTFKNNFVLNVNGIYNYSDNNYTIHAPYVGEGNSIGPDRSYKLFNEGYRSGSVLVEGGVIKKKWADRFLIGLIASQNKKDRERGRSMVLHPAGEVHTTDKGFTPTLKYQKKDLGIKNLSLNVAAIYSYTQAMRVDTSSRIYNWDGSYSTRAIGVTSGELSWYKTKFRFNDNAVFNTATLEYQLGERHTFTINNTYSYFRRKGSDPVASQYDANIAFSDPNTLRKNITGVAYKLALLDGHWNTTVFAKLFNMSASVKAEDENSEGDYIHKDIKNTEHGVGIATSYFLTKEVLLKTSYEHTARLPDSEEMFGDGLLLQPNVGLQPEKSHNINLEVLYTGRITDNHSITAETGFIYRLPKNMIRIQAIGVQSQYQNQANTRVMGVEGAVRYSYKRRLNIELNATYQNQRNHDKNISDATRNDRIPYVPYLWSNAIVGWKSKEMGDSRLQLGFSWVTMYVQEFYLKWPSQGTGNTKYTVPTQFSHDASVTLSSLGGKYNISLSCWNLADANLYDNFKVQKPGRAFNVKLRFYISKFRD